MTTFETSQNPFFNTNNDEKQDESVSSNSDETDNEIPYHARVYARPFTYGKLPKDFKKSDLNHVLLEDLPNPTGTAHRPVPMLIPCSSRNVNGLFDCPSLAIKPSPQSFPSSTTDFHRVEPDELMSLPKTEEYSLSALLPRDPTEFNLAYIDDSLDTIGVTIKPSAVLPSSPSMQRKNGRPSISPSRPVLRKTPSRQEFEEMLRERREQSLREQNVALKEAQNASIRKDLDELQEKLNKRALLETAKLTIQSNLNDNSCREIVKLVETIDLPDEKATDDILCQSSAIVEAPNKYEPTLIIADRKRPETPAFPVWSKSSFEDRCSSPYPLVTPNSPVLQRASPPVPIRNERKKSPLPLPSLASINQQKTRERHVPETAHDVAPHLVTFAKNSSQFWYKPYITREEALALLRQALPGTFIIRNSTTYKNAFGLVIRVAKPLQDVPLSENSCNNEILVRHFLLEPTSRGVRLKGCINEPTFTSLSALVYQHSINSLALPCKLIIPTQDLKLSVEDTELLQSQKQLMDQGAACNVLYLFSMDMESLTGDEAIRKAVYEMYAQSELRGPIEVHFKVSQNGITLTDNKRRLFFRRHYAAANISHVGLDPDSRFFSVMAIDEGLQRAVNKTIFAFVARPASGSRDNQCHVFCDLSATQPASAIISFAHKMLLLNLNAKIV